MASANVTLGSEPHEFEVDATARVATLNTRGGWLKNTHATEIIYINVSTTAAVTQPGGAGNAILKPGQIMQIPHQYGSFNFDAAGTSYCQYSPAPMA